MFNSVDIYCPPSPKGNSDKDCELTIGDLHSNALLFIYFLQQHKIMSLTDEQYAELVKNYVALEQAKETQLSDEDIILKTKAIIKIIEEASIINKPKLRLIGDEMADRGVNDLFILLLLKKLYENHVPYKILLSNHGLCFISLFLGWCKQSKQNNWMMNPSQMTSFDALKSSVDLKICEFKQIEQWVLNFYFPFIQVIDYSLCPQSQRLTLYSHAAIGYNDLISLAFYTKTPFRADNMLELAQTLEHIEHQFKKNIFPQVCDLLLNITDIDDSDAASSYFSKFMNSIIWKICWNRDYSFIMLHRPASLNSFFMRYVHGHDHEISNNTHCISLDGYLGKSSQDNIGELKELKSHDITLKEYLNKPNQENTWGLFFKSMIFPKSYKNLYPWVGLIVAYMVLKKYNQYIPTAFLKNILQSSKYLLGISSEKYTVNNRP